MQPPSIASAAVEHDALQEQAAVAGGGGEVGSTTSIAAPDTIEQRLQVSYVLPTAESVTSPQITTTPSTSTPETAAAEAAPPLDKQTLKWASTHLLPVTEAMVRSMASSNAALPITFTAASRTMAMTAEAPAAPPPVAGKSAKPVKAGTVAEEVPWQADQQHVAALDLAPLLVGDTSVSCTWPQKGLAMPVQLQAYSTVRVCIEVCRPPSVCRHAYSQA